MAEMPLGHPGSAIFKQLGNQGYVANKMDGRFNALQLLLSLTVSTSTSYPQPCCNNCRFKHAVCRSDSKIIREVKARYRRRSSRSAKDLAMLECM